MSAESPVETEPVSSAWIRSVALNAAVELAKTRQRPTPLPDLTAQADRLALWLLNGTLPPPPPGMTDY